MSRKGLTRLTKRVSGYVWNEMRGLRGIATECVLSERVEYCGMGAHEYLN